MTDRIIAQLEEGTLPWVRPWDNGKAALGLPRNGGTGRRYSGINVLILWHRLFEQGYGSQRWLTYRQAQALGGNVRKGEQGTTVCYADRFTPKDGDTVRIGPDGEPRQIAFLKRFTVFNIDQCEGLDVAPSTDPVATWNPAISVPRAEALIAASGADIRIGGGEAYYAPQDDYIRVPRPEHFHEPINWYRTALHELGHWTGHRLRLDRLPDDGFGSPAYAREELIAEMASAFLCAELGIVPTVRHADYLGAWLSVLREDSRAIFRAASQASKAADYLLDFIRDAGGDDDHAR
ncbi:MAG: zincin-like metallopeptidase domain-containing protein [bacterium]|nr:zincin-like metallopeptidase domain-containing protein [bacterium]